MVQFNQRRQSGIAEHAPRMHGCAARKGERCSIFLIKVDAQQFGAAIADIFCGHHFVSVLERFDRNVALVARNLPIRRGIRIQHENPCLAFHARANTVRNDRVGAGRVGALVAPLALTRAFEGRVVVAVRAERVRLAA